MSSTTDSAVLKNKKTYLLVKILREKEKIVVVACETPSLIQRLASIRRRKPESFLLNARTVKGIQTSKKVGQPPVFLGLTGTQVRLRSMTKL
jgi:hypothetical protein